MKPATRARRLRAAVLIAAGTAGSMAVLSAVAPAGAVTTIAADSGSGTSTSPGASASPSAGNGPSAGKVAVAQGLNAAAVGAHRVFPVKGSTKETVSFVLRMRNTRSLESLVEAGMPHGFVSVQKFATGYGQTRSHIAALQKYLKRFGIQSTVYGDRLDVSATGRAWQWNKALSVTQSVFTAAAIPARGNQPARPAVTFHGTTDRPLLPKSLASFVYSILGLTNYPIASSNAVHTPTPETRSTAASLQRGNRTPANFARQYGLTPLQRAGARGQGQTLGIITYASLQPSDATHFWSSVLKIKTKANRIELDNIDGGSGRVSNASGSGETMLDVEQSGALAPQANIVVYQAPNTDYGQADAWFSAASQNKAATISTSWGQSEIFNEAVAANRTESATYSGIYNEAGLEMAAQGQSAFVASGDFGAYDDVGDPTSYTELSVDNPADSPWLTASGGTTNAGRIPLTSQSGSLKVVTIPSQRTWGWDYLFPYWYLFLDRNGAAFSSEPPFVADTSYAAGSGGGYSVVESQPAYQSKISNIDDYHYVSYETPSNYVDFGTKTTCTPPAGVSCLPTRWTAWPGASTATAPVVQSGTFSGSGGRAVPDIAADADPYTGYEVYFSRFPSVGLPALAPGWGGTSFVAPQLNGSAAVIDSYLHHRVGFWNPAIYRFAASKSLTPFTPLDDQTVNNDTANNDNLYYTGTAGAIYNPGSGLGVPNLDKLALDFRYHS